MTDAFDDIEDALARWAAWHRRANKLPTGGYRNPLAALQAEGAEVERQGRQTQTARKIMLVIRSRLRLRIAEALRQGDAATAQRLAMVLAKETGTLSGLPWASMIAGTGYRRDSENPEEERMERILNRLGKEAARLVRLNYLWWAPQALKAKRLQLSLRTYQRRLEQAKGAIAVEWRSRALA